MTVNCFKCDRPLELDPGTGYDSIGMLFDGTIWQSYGNYGSTLFDSVSENEGKLEMYVCDECMKAKKEAIVHLKKKSVRSDEEIEGVKTTTLKTWAEKSQVEDFTKL